MNILSKRFALPHLYQPVDGSLKLWISGRTREGTGKRISDLSGNGNSGDIIGATLTNTPLNHPCLSFDGTDDYVKVAGSTNTDTPNKLTFEAWIYPESFDVTNGDMIAIRGWTAGWAKSWQFRINANSKLDAYVTSDGQTDLGLGASTATISTGQWTQVGLIIDTAIPRAWYIINGQLEQTSTNPPSSLHAGARPMTIGIHQGSLPGNEWAGNPLLAFDGLIDEVRILNRALTSEEVMKRYEETRHLFGY